MLVIVIVQHSGGGRVGEWRSGEKAKAAPRTNTTTPVPLPVAVVKEQRFWDRCGLASGALSQHTERREGGRGGRKRRES